MKTYVLSQLSNIRVLGRTTKERNPLTLFWTGSGIEVNVKAEELWVDIEADYFLYEPWIDILIDGALFQRRMLSKGRQHICLFRGMNPEEEKIVRLLRDTQAMSDDPMTLLQIMALQTDGTFETLPEYRMKLEFIGDSITTGEGVTGARKLQDWITGCFNAVDNYTYMTAESLHAEYHCLSQGGFGVYCDFLGNKHRAMPAVYEQVCGLATGIQNEKLGAQAAWDFTEWQPDAILINLGTNDANSFIHPLWTDPITGEENPMRLNANGTMKEEDLIKIEKAVIQFLTKLRRLNPKSHMIWCYGMLGNEISPTLRSAVKKYCQVTGDKKAEFLELPNTSSEGIGSRSHPGHLSHIEASKVLVNRLATIL